MSIDSFSSYGLLEVGNERFGIHRLEALASRFDLDRLPYSLRVLLENLLRTEDGKNTTRATIEAVASYERRGVEVEVGFVPARVLLQDFTGVPCLVDLASMREAFAEMGGDPARINPLQPVDLVIDHSVQVDSYGSLRSFDENVRLEFERNAERYRFLKWGQQAFRNLRVVPPGTGIVHQVNLEYLAQVVCTTTDHRGTPLLVPDSLVGTDSHTTMVNALGVFGWGVGGIEAEAAMLGQPVAMLVPEVMGVELVGTPRPGVTATDVVLTLTERLRARGVVGKFVEFTGSGLAALSLADRATLANMAPEYGATMGFFPVDEETLRYLRLTGRSDAHVQRVEAYCRAQRLFWTPDARTPEYADRVVFDLTAIEPSLAGPRRPQDRVPLAAMAKHWSDEARSLPAHAPVRIEGVRGGSFELDHGRVVLAAITSCTNTSNPSVMLAAGLLAKAAVERGLSTPPWVKTSLAPGSQVVTGYLQASGTLGALETLGFHVVGYGCTTCIGNSGPLDEPIRNAIRTHDLTAVAVLSGNRNFEGRVSPDVKANYLASPPLVVAYALAGRIDIDFATEPLGADASGAPVFLRDVWPTGRAIDEAVSRFVTDREFVTRYADVFTGPTAWRETSVPTTDRFTWEPESTYLAASPFVHGVGRELPPAPTDIEGARCLAWLGDSTTTDHISPAGSIARESPAGRYLEGRGVSPRDFNQYGARRGHHEVMVRGTFANVRLANRLVPGERGGKTRYLGEESTEGPILDIADAAERYRAQGIPLVVFAGKEYGTGSSRDWAAKGTKLQGVVAVIASSFERIHRSNLIGMGVLPLEWLEGDAETLGLDGTEQLAIRGITAGLRPLAILSLEARSPTRIVASRVRCRIDSPMEAEYLRHGGILPFVLRRLATDESR